MHSSQRDPEYFFPHWHSQLWALNRVATPVPVHQSAVVHAVHAVPSEDRKCVLRHVEQSDVVKPGLQRQLQASLLPSSVTLMAWSLQSFLTVQGVHVDFPTDPTGQTLCDAAAVGAGVSVGFDGAFVGVGVGVTLLFGVTVLFVGVGVGVAGVGGARVRGAGVDIVHPVIQSLETITPFGHWGLKSVHTPHIVYVRSLTSREHPELPVRSQSITH